MGFYLFQNRNPCPPPNSGIFDGRGPLRFMVKSLFRMMLVLISLFLCSGCVSDKERQREIREKTEVGEYEEAERLAFKYFAADKLLLLISLEYINDQKTKALKRFYKDNLLVDEWEWKEVGYGHIKVDGRVINQGDRTVTGFAIKIEYIRKGKVIDRVILTETKEIMPAMYQQFEHTKRSLKGCDEVSVDIVDFAIKE